MPSIPERVARGVAFLDRTLAGWDERIDLDLLNLSSTCRCILGQEFASHPDARDAYASPFEVAVEELVIGKDDAVELGFDRHEDEAPDVYDELTAEWRRVILARRGGAQ